MSLLNRLRKALMPKYKPSATAANIKVSVCDTRSPLNNDVMVLKIFIIPAAYQLPYLLQVKTEMAGKSSKIRINI